jgi:hypothetical protein
VAVVPGNLREEANMRWRITLTAALVAFVAVSCDQQPAGPATDEVAEAPTFEFSNGPDEPGSSQILRGYWVGGYAVFFDPVTELMVIPTWSDGPCVDFDEATPIPWQAVSSPADPGLEMYFEAGRLNALLIEAPYTCADVIATGIIHNRGHDNAGWMWDGEHNRTQSIGFRFNGKIGDYIVKWSLQCVWGGLTKPDFKSHCKESISIK